MSIRRCLVCGRYFHEGQGIVINYYGFSLEFHSSRCAAKFLRRLLEELEPSCGRDAVSRLVDEYRKALKILDERSAKKI